MEEISPYTQEARAELVAAGVRVQPSAAGGGFYAENVPDTAMVWAATEEGAWVNAWGWFTIAKWRRKG